MKKLLALVFLFSITSSAYSQLEIIDKVAEVLIPGITNSIKEVIDAKGKKVNEDELKKIKNEIIQSSIATFDIVDSDLKNLKALNEIFKYSGQLYDDLGGLKSLTNQNLLSKVLSTNNHELYKEMIFSFNREWKQLEDKKSKLTNLETKPSDASLLDDLSKLIAKIDENLIDLTTEVGLSKNPSRSMDINSAKNYVEGMVNSSTYIDNIEDNIEDIQSLVSSRISSFSTSMENAKTKINGMKEE